MEDRLLLSFCNNKDVKLYQWVGQRLPGNMGAYLQSPTFSVLLIIERPNQTLEDRSPICQIKILPYSELKEVGYDTES